MVFISEKCWLVHFCVSYSLNDAHEWIREHNHARPNMVWMSSLSLHLRIETFHLQEVSLRDLGEVTLYMKISRLEGGSIPPPHPHPPAGSPPQTLSF